MIGGIKISGFDCMSSACAHSDSVPCNLVAALMAQHELHTNAAP